MTVYLNRGHPLLLKLVLELQLGVFLNIMSTDDKNHYNSFQNQPHANISGPEPVAHERPQAAHLSYSCFMNARKTASYRNSPFSFEQIRREIFDLLRCSLKQIS